MFFFSCVNVWRMDTNWYTVYMEQEWQTFAETTSFLYIRLGRSFFPSVVSLCFEMSHSHSRFMMCDAWNFYHPPLILFQNCLFVWYLQCVYSSIMKLFRRTFSSVTFLVIRRFFFSNTSTLNESFGENLHDPK